MGPHSSPYGLLLEEQRMRHNGRQCPAPIFVRHATVINYLFIQDGIFSYFQHLICFLCSIVERKLFRFASVVILHSAQCPNFSGVGVVFV